MLLTKFRSLSSHPNLKKLLQTTPFRAHTIRNVFYPPNSLYCTTRSFHVSCTMFMAKKTKNKQEQQVQCHS